MNHNVKILNKEKAKLFRKNPFELGMQIFLHKTQVIPEFLNRPQTENEYITSTINSTCALDIVTD